MKKQATLLCAVALLFLGAAKCEPKQNEETMNQELPGITHVKDFTEPKDNVPVVISEAAVEGDVLTLVVQYSGGCEEHLFDLRTGDNYLKSLPVQLDLTLVHNNNGDACREFVQDTLQFNVSSVQHSSGNEVILRFTNSEITASYTY